MEKYYLYIVLTRPDTIISKLIKLIKKDEYTHAAISIDKELDYMYGFGRKYTFTPFIGIFKQEEINKGIYKYHKVLPGIILEVEVTKQQYEKAIGLLNHFISNNKLYKYNYKGLLHGILDKEMSYDNRFLCSEFVYHLLKESGVVDFNIPRNLVRPQDLLKLKTNIVFVGNLKELKPENEGEVEKEVIGLSAIYHQVKGSILNYMTSA